MGRVCEEMKMNVYNHPPSDNAIILKKGESLSQFAIRAGLNTSDMIFNCASLCDKYRLFIYDNTLRFLFHDGSTAVFEEHQWRNCYKSKALRKFEHKEEL